MKFFGLNKFNKMNVCSCMMRSCALPHCAGCCFIFVLHTHKLTQLLMLMNEKKAFTVFVFNFFICFPSIVDICFLNQHKNSLQINFYSFIVANGRAYSKQIWTVKPTNQPIDRSESEKKNNNKYKSIRFNILVIILLTYFSTHLKFTLFCRFLLRLMKYSGIVHDLQSHEMRTLKLFSCVVCLYSVTHSVLWLNRTVNRLWNKQCH